MRVAAIDIGTNTVLLLVAERDAGGTLRAVEQRATITRLGAGVDRTRRLDAAAIERALACLAAYAEIVRSSGAARLAVVATSAMRDAAGGEVLREGARRLLGVDARVISGEDEARLTFRGALAGLPLGDAPELAVFDIGGGSTEVVLGQPASDGPSITFSASFDVGSVRLTERHGEDRAAIARAAALAIGRLPALSTRVPPIGVAGTMTTLAAVSLGLTPYRGDAVHGHVMTRETLGAVVDRLAALDAETRRAVPGLDPGRADVIVAGGVIALTLLDAWGASAVRVSDGGVRWGVADELLAS